MIQRTSPTRALCYAALAVLGLAGPVHGQAAVLPGQEAIEMEGV